MAGYTFGQDEYVILRAQGVSIDEKKAFSMPHDSELMLTNHNIVFPVKGMFGKVKRYEVFPLSSIRILDGRPLCRLDSSEFMEEKLEVSFLDDVVSFRFRSLDARKEIRAWINELYKLLVGHEAPEEVLGRQSGEDFFEGFADMAEFAGDLTGAFQNAVNRRAAKTAPVVACRCPSCNASIQGRRGTTVTCPFCETHVTIS